MTTLTDEINAYMKLKAEEYRKVLAGEIALPPCSICKQDSTHVSERITPAGYHVWRCEDHAVNERGPLWGSDPGWLTKFTSIYDASTK